MRNRSHVGAIAAAAILAACFLTPVRAASYSINKVAEVGDAWSVIPGSTTFTGFGAVVLDNAGNVSFGADFGDSGHAAFALYGGTQTFIVDQLDPLVASIGNITFRTDDGSLIQQWTVSNGIATIVSTAPGSLASPPLVNDSGTVTYFGRYGSSTPAIWQAAGGSTNILVDGASFAGTSGGPAMRSIESVRMNGSATVAFDAFVASNSGEPADALWKVASSGQIQITVKAGDAAGADQFTGVHPPAINDAGHIAFSAETNAVDERIYVHDGTSLTEVARTNTLYGAGPSSFKFGSSSSLTTQFPLGDPLIDHNDNVLFRATRSEIGGSVTTGSNSQCIAISRPTSGLSIVAYEDEDLSALGLSGLHFSTAISSAIALFPSMSVNGNDQVVFEALLENGATEAGNGIFLWDPTNGLQAMAYVGGTLTVDGTPKTVSGLLLQGESGGEDGYTDGFNNAGEIAFLAAFTDGSFGVFLASPSPTPEPASLGLLAAGVIGLALRRRR